MPAALPFTTLHMMIPKHSRLILVRHGQSTYNLAGRLQGCCDLGVLTSAGAQQAGRTAERLSGRVIDRIYCSPLARASQTAEIIRLRSGEPDLVVDDLLREVDVPAWEGMRGADLKRKHPQTFDAYMNRPAEFSLSVDGEARFPWRDLYHRAGVFLQNRAQEVARGNTLIVSHGGTIRALVHVALGLSIADHNIPQQSNCGISEVGRERSATRYRLHCLNDTGHLDRFPPKIKAAKSGVRIVFVGAGEGSGSQEGEKRFGAIDFDRLWIERSCGDEARCILPPGGASTTPFDGADEADVSRIAGLVQDLRGREDRLSTLGFIVRLPVLGGFARRLLGTEIGLLGRIARSGGAGAVIHDSTSHPVPVVQAIRTW